MFNLLALPAIALAAFAREDVQLFELRDEIIKDLGPKTDFYSWIGVRRGASAKEIMKQFRKVSRKMHPDRNPGKAATDRFARLNQVYKILRSPMRDRYDHYLSKGFPKFDEISGEWKLHHFRPNLLLTAVFIALTVTFIHFLILKATAYSRRNQLQQVSEDAKAEARKSTPSGVITQATMVQVNGNSLVVYPSGEVKFEGTLVDPESILEPTVYDTVLVKLAYKFINPQVNEVAEVAEDVKENLKEKAGEVEEHIVDTTTKAVETLKKGASRRRPAGAKGKAKIF